MEEIEPTPSKSECDWTPLSPSPLGKGGGSKDVAQVAWNGPGVSDGDYRKFS